MVKASASSFCQRCTSMLEAFNDGAIELTHNVTRTELVAARDSGCYICYVLLQLDHFETPNEGDVRLEWRFDDAMQRFYVRYLWFSFHRQATGDDRSKSNEASLSAYEAPVLSSDPEALRLVGTWLRWCTSTHRKCEGSRGSGYMPSRLLDLTDGRIRLISTIDVKFTGGYATLSHCWGKDPTFLTLNISNYERFLQSIPVDELPKTFRDSAILCRSLKIDYLWIDSLCILQGLGSEKDWLQHIAIMPDIYRHALLNVSADWGSSSNDGLFHERSVILRQPRVAFNQGILSGSFNITCSDIERLESRLKTAPLQERGWVMQERILSPRIVHFTKEQMCWECSESSDICERWPNGAVGWGRKDRELLGLGTRKEFGNAMVEREHKFNLMKLVKRQLRQKLGMSRSLHPNHNLVETMDSYSSIVSAYSKRAFTYPDLDKLPAFGSIAEHFSLASNAAYIAGFLEIHLPSALAWHVAEIQEARPATATYRCPSWSWASVDSPVYLYCGLRTQDTSRDSRNSNLYLPLAQMKSYSVELKDQSNPFGQITGASMILQAPMVQCRWVAGIYQRSQGALQLRIPGINPLPSGRWCFGFDTIEDSKGDQQHVSIVLIDIVIDPVYNPRTETSHQFKKKMSLYVIIVREIRCDDAIRYRRIGGGELRFNHARCQELQALPRREIVLI